MAIPRELIEGYPGLWDASIITAYRGSIAHGMYLQNSDPNSVDDKDVMAVCVPPVDYYLGLKEFGSKGTQEIMRKVGSVLWDIVVYEARKFFNLLLQGNPNVLALLWLEKNYYLRTTEAGELLIANRDLFSGRHVYNSFVGYAYGQLRRMTHQAYDGHMGAKRKALADKYGYDTKNAAHLIRLLRMGTEFLKDGELRVLRQDASQLLEIKRGEWTLKDVQAEADRWFRLTENAYLASTLPAKPDKDAINALCVSVVRTALEDQMYGYE